MTDDGVELEDADDGANDRGPDPWPASPPLNWQAPPPSALTQRLGRETPPARPMSWQAPPPAPPVPVFDLGQPVERTIHKGGATRLLAAVVGVALLAGGTVFALANAGGGGPGSPEQAVDDLLAAASNEDVLGVLAALDPVERETFKQPMEHIFSELERLEVVDGLDLAAVDGIDLEFTDVTYRVEDARDDLARVYFEGGTAKASVEGAELPVGAFVTDLLDELETDIGDLSESDTETIEPDAESGFVVARLTEDGWRVSVAYTIAEQARIAAGAPMPAPEDGIAPRGSDSPAAAVDGLVRAAANLDLRGVIARLAPTEAAALQEYAALFIEDAEAAVAEMRAEGAPSITVNSLDLKADVNGSRALVEVTGYDFEVSVDGSTIQVVGDLECVEITGDFDSDAFFFLEDSPFEDGPFCVDDAADFTGTAGLGFPFGDEVEAPKFPPFNEVTFGITAVEVDGEWFVAPVRTYLDMTVAGLRSINREHLDVIADFVQAFVEGFSVGFDEEFSEVGEEIEGSLEPVPGDPDFDDDFGTGAAGFADLSFEELILEGLPPDMAACVRDGVDGLPPEVREALESSFSSGGNPSPEALEAFEAFDEIFYECEGSL